MPPVGAGAPKAGAGALEPKPAAGAGVPKPGFVLLPKPEPPKPVLAGAPNIPPAGATEIHVQNPKKLEYPRIITGRTHASLPFNLPGAGAPNNPPGAGAEARKRTNLTMRDNKIELL